MFGFMMVHVPVGDVAIAEAPQKIQPPIVKAAQIHFQATALRGLQPTLQNPTSKSEHEDACKLSGEKVPR